MSSSPPQNPNQWRYTWETLAHIPTLRLYLFNPAAFPSSDLRDLTAALLPAASLLHLRCLRADGTAALLPAASLLHLRCLRADGAAEIHLHVPVPRVLIDPTAPVDCVAEADHIEVKLALLLPVDHPMVSLLDSGAEEEDRRAPICLGSDLKSLSSGDVHFYCKACSTKLTRQPLRKHTLDRVFVNSLLESAEDELSFRTIVRDLGTKSVKLQIVLLNSKAWSSSGYCDENASMKSSVVTALQPIVKVLFSDCSSATEADSRIIKDWSTKTHVEEVYMMPWLIEELDKHLKMSQDKLPISCSSLQGMFLSTLER